MPIKVLVNGAFGRMGQMAVETLQNNDTFELVGQTGREYDLSASIRDSGTQVVVDFTSAESVFHNAKTIIESDAHPVIGTSGLKHDQVQQLQEICASKKLGGLIVPNFSIGAVLMMRCAQKIIKYMPNAEILEFHHDKKADSPSGTAIKTAEMLAEARETTPETKNTTETVPGARGAIHQNIPIHAVRLPGLLAHQQIMFGSEGETLTIKHDSINRQCFMPGLVLACQKVLELDELVYGLENIL